MTTHGDCRCMLLWRSRHDSAAGCMPSTHDMSPTPNSCCPATHLRASSRSWRATTSMRRCLSSRPTWALARSPLRSCHQGAQSATPSTLSWKRCGASLGPADSDVSHAAAADVCCCCCVDDVQCALQEGLFDGCRPCAANTHGSDQNCANGTGQQTATVTTMLSKTRTHACSQNAHCIMIKCKCK